MRPPGLNGILVALYHVKCEFIRLLTEDLSKEFEQFVWHDFDTDVTWKNRLRRRFEKGVYSGRSLWFWLFTLVVRTTDCSFNSVVRKNSVGTVILEMLSLQANRWYNPYIRHCHHLMVSYISNRSLTIYRTWKCCWSEFYRVRFSQKCKLTVDEVEPNSHRWSTWKQNLF